MKPRHPIILRDNFVEYSELYVVPENLVVEAYNNPDRLERLDNNASLYFKQFDNNDAQRNHLLVATDQQSDGELFAFCYWIPTEYTATSGSLLETLVLFANRFALRIRVGDNEGLFLKRAKRLQGRSVQWLDLIEVEAPAGASYQSCAFTRNTLLGSLTHVELFYAFAINVSKYLIWLNDVPTTDFLIDSNQYEFVQTNLVDFLDPSGKTKVKIYRGRSKANDSKPPSQSTIRVPSIYKKQFLHIVSEINSLEEGEVVSFKIAFSGPKCLFCGGGELSKEHIIPKWLRTFLPETKFQRAFAPYTMPIENMAKDAIRLENEQSSHGYTGKLVCVNCNGTWMSKIEEETKRILISEGELIKAVPANISREDASWLSKWLVLKSLLFANKPISNLYRIPKSIFEDLKNHVISPGWTIEATTAKNFKVDSILGKGLAHSKSIQVKNIPQEQAEKMAENLFTCSLHLGHLLFRVSYLAPSFPLIRKTCLKETQPLHPFNSNLPHASFSGDSELWDSAKSSGIELHVFSRLGLLLTE